MIISIYLGRPGEREEGRGEPIPDMHGRRHRGVQRHFKSPGIL